MNDLIEELKFILLKTIEQQIVIGIYNYGVCLLEEGLLTHIENELSFWDEFFELSDSDKEYTYQINKVIL